MKISLHRKFDFATFKTGNIDGIEITYGIKCEECRCKYNYNCKRKQSFKFHNFKVSLSRKFGIRLPIFFESRICENLSGTSLCPMKLDRIYSCWDCKSAYGEDSCVNQQRLTDIENGNFDIELGLTCKYFELSDYGNSWDRETGRRIFENK